MQVFVEFALLENFCMDFTLLYCAKLVSKNLAALWRVLIAAAIGACFAVVFPLFKLAGVWAIVVKILSGLLLCLICGRFKSFKSYFKFTAAFLGFTFALGGGLIAIFSLTGTEYSAGEGFILSSVPIGIPAFGALILIIAARRLAQKLKKVGKTVVDLKIFAGGNSVSLSGFFDSGNKVYLRGSPVSVIPLIYAAKLIDEERIKDTVKIHTVAGSKKLKVFTADRIEINNGGRIDTLSHVKLGISANASCEAVLHPDLLEE